jgi:hypothetical protein
MPEPTELPIGAMTRSVRASQGSSSNGSCEVEAAGIAPASPHGPSVRTVVGRTSSPPRLREWFLAYGPEALVRRLGVVLAVAVVRAGVLNRVAVRVARRDRGIAVVPEQSGAPADVPEGVYHSDVSIRAGRWNVAAIVTNAPIATHAAWCGHRAVGRVRTRDGRRARRSGIGRRGGRGRSA